MPAQLPDPKDSHPWTLAEWVEATLLLEDLPELSRTSFTERFAVGARPEGADIDKLFKEIDRRNEAVPAMYPYTTEETRIVRRADLDATVYDFLLLAAIEGAPYRVENRFDDVNPAFELLTREALKRHLGPGAEAVRFAWPTRDDRPDADFEKAVRWLAQRMKLEIGNLSDVDVSDNDGGLDVAAWRCFGDGRPGHVAILAQCTVEVAEWEGKTVDLPPNQWSTWIKMGRPPVVALVIPFVLPVDAKVWSRMAYRTDLIVDRIRLCELLDGADLIQFPEYDEMKQFVTVERKAITDAIATPPPAGQLKKAGATKAASPRIAKRRGPVKKRKTEEEKKAGRRDAARRRAAKAKEQSVAGSSAGKKKPIKRSGGQ